MSVLAILLTLLLFAGVGVLSAPNSVLYQIANAPGNMTMDSEQEYGKPEDCDNKEDDDFDGLIDEKDYLNCPNIASGGSSQDLTKPVEGPDFSSIQALIKCDETFTKKINPSGHCEGTNKSDRILGSVNRDKIYAYYGDDWINGSSGSDYIYGDHGKNVIYGHTGNDEIDGHEGSNTIWGGDGADTISGSHLADKIWGGDGPDKIWGGLAGFDSLYGNDGSDTITGGYNRDMIEGGDGNDIISGDDGADHILGGPGDDKIYNFKASPSSVDAHRDFIDCGSGNDEIWISNADRRINCEKVNLTN